MRISKTANISISLSWIFMIVVGSIFLLFAYNIISKYQSIEEEKYNLELKWALRETFNKVGRTSGIEETKLNPLSTLFKNKRVEILCVDGDAILSLNGELDANNQFLKNYPTFMTIIDQEKQDNTYLAVESFRMPFKTSSVLALVSKKNLIVFDENSDISDDLIEKFSKSSYSELTYVTEDFSSFQVKTFISSIEDKNYNSVMFVSDEDRELPHTILSEIDLPSYLVSFNRSSSNTGIIIYTDESGETFHFPFFDWDGSLTLETMAIFSSPETFDCSYNLLIENTKEVYEFYKIKTKTLSNLSKSKFICSGSVGSISQQSLHYDLLEESLNDVIEHIDFPYEHKFNKPSNLTSLIGEVELNQEKLELLSCSYIY